MRNQKALPLTVLLLLTFATGRAAAVNFLFDGAQTAYAIIIPDDASASERTAAKELRKYIRQISGAQMVVEQATAHRCSGSDAAHGAQARCGGKHIYVGWNKGCGLEIPDSDDEAFTYRTVGDDLHIVGGSERGTMYGVYTFLERELGVRWYTSTFTKVPRLEHYALPRLDHSERPALRQRLDFCYDALRNPAWMAHNRMNTMHTKVSNNYGTFTATWGAHTFQKLIPPAQYFDEHPEYFSLVRGRRSDKAQLCLSNDDMRRELTANLLLAIEDNPGYWCYDVSQNDNDLNCECHQCKALVEHYGGQAGALLWFVNQVAADVERGFPEARISTFAYRTTRHAPRLGRITPADNVVIRLCDIECCMAHPIGQCTQNNSFSDDLEAWRRLTPNLYIWDYANSFYHYLMPFPNFRAMAANLRLHATGGATGVMMEGAHDAPWSEFSELKQWLTARLLWDPWQDTDSLAAMFIADYYGSAAPSVLLFYDRCQRLADDSRHLTLMTQPDDTFYGGAFLDDGLRLTSQAVADADDGTQRQRARRLLALMLYMKLRRQQQEATTDGTLRKLCDIIAADSTILRENKYTLQRVLHDMGIDHPAANTKP